MAIESIGAAPVQGSGDLQQLGLAQEDFLKILLTQLTFQDPLKPMDNQEFIAQMAQFTSLEQSRQTNDKIDSLLTVQSATQAIGLIGQTVEVATPGGPEVGTVTTVVFENAAPRLTIQTSTGFLADIGLSQVRLVRG